MFGKSFGDEIQQPEVNSLMAQKLKQALKQTKLPQLAGSSPTNYFINLQASTGLVCERSRAKQFHNPKTQQEMSISLNQSINNVAGKHIAKCKALIKRDKNKTSNAKNEMVGDWITP